MKTKALHHGDAWAQASHACMLTKRYHVRNSYTGVTYFAYDDRKTAETVRDVQQADTDAAKANATWYVTDTFERPI
jgi:hypothetical protein